MNNKFNIQDCISSLKKHRSIFYSESDFQFALGWDIKKHYPEADVHFEAPIKGFVENFPKNCHKQFINIRVDIVIFLNKQCIPIELKYKTAKLSANIDGENYELKNHGAQDIGRYGCLKDIQRLEVLSDILPSYYEGYTIWLTNDASYGKTEKIKAVDEQFSIHDGVIKSGKLKWSVHASLGTTKGRESPIELKNTYKIEWNKYSLINNDKNGIFYSAITKVVRH